MNPVLNHIAGGWRLNLIFITPSGAPLSWTGVDPIYSGGGLQMDGHNVDRAFANLR
jgi:hypothetical protein